VHAVSVGEVLSARPLISELRAAYPKLRLFLSTTTLTGQQLARRSVPDVDAVFYFPFDWTITARRTLNVVRPRLFVMTETEIWPNLLRECKRARRPDVDGERPDFLPIVSPLPPRPSVHEACAG
jgi:3-deoxy-D-manno-octulosonic-acid transferase